MNDLTALVILLTDFDGELESGLYPNEQAALDNAAAFLRQEEGVGADELAATREAISTFVNERGLSFRFSIEALDLPRFRVTYHNDEGALIVDRLLFGADTVKASAVLGDVWNAHGAFRSDRAGTARLYRFGEAEPYEVIDNA